MKALDIIKLAQPDKTFQSRTIIRTPRKPKQAPPMEPLPTPGVIIVRTPRKPQPQTMASQEWITPKKYEEKPAEVAAKQVAQSAVQKVSAINIIAGVYPASS